jgi:hypothetical protein
LPQILFTSFSLSHVSTLLKINDWNYLLAIIQPVCLLFCLWLIIRIRLLHSMMIVITIYGFNLLVESFLYIILNHFFKHNYAVMPYLFVIGGLNIIINFIIAWILNTYRFGFSFIHSHSIQGFRFKGDNHKLLLFLMISFILLGLSSYSFYFHKLLMLYVLFGILIIVGILLRVSYQREFAD